MQGRSSGLGERAQTATEFLILLTLVIGVIVAVTLYVKSYVLAPRLEEEEVYGREALEKAFGGNRT